MLLFFASSSAAAAGESSTSRQTTTAANNNDDAGSVVLGLENIGQSACTETEAFCDKTVLRALGEDKKLASFLKNVRAIAREASPGSAEGYSTAVLDPTSLKFPEMLALGCCLSAGECMSDIAGVHDAAASENASPAAIATSPASAAKNASIASARAAAAEILVMAAGHKDASKMPAVSLLGANAFACAPPGGKTRCGTEMVELYRKAGNAGFDVGNLRAGEVLLARFSGPLIDAGSGASCPPGTPGNPGSPPPGDHADAATARALFKGLLVTDLDRSASRRMKELTKAEELWVSSKLGRPDAAYEAADLVVDAGAKVVGFLVVVALPLYLARETRVVAAARDRAWRWSGCAGFVRQWRRELEFFRFVKPRVVNGGRAAARVDKRQSAKKIAKQMYREALKHVD